MLNKKEIKNCTLPELEDGIKELGEPTFRARQIFEWIYKKGIFEFGGMSNISKTLRKSLQARYTNFVPPVETKSVSSDGTVKYLFKLQDGNFIESVLIPVTGKNTLCLSTQVGCRFACVFCASGSSGFVRNLSVSEIVSQALHVRFIDKKEVNNLVFMGIGEPLDNMEPLVKALEIINDERGLTIGARRITISTMGLVPGIKKLADLKKQFGLSISLHAADDALRNRLMPVNKKYPIKDVLEAAKYFFENTKRQVTFEYILFRDLNDDPANADRLAQLLKSLPYPLQKVNLLLFNETLRGEFRSSDISKAEEFQQNLKKKLISATIRRPRGRDIAAACGQLRSRLKPS